MGHSRWETYKAKRLREMEADAQSHPEYEQAGRDLELGDQLSEIRERRGLSQKVVAELLLRQWRSSAATGLLGSRQR